MNRNIKILLIATASTFMAGCVSKEQRVAEENVESYWSGLVNKYSECKTIAFQAYPVQNVDVTAGVGNSASRSYTCTSMGSSQVNCTQDGTSGSALLKEAAKTANMGRRYKDINQDARNKFEQECVVELLSTEERDELKRLIRVWDDAS